MRDAVEGVVDATGMFYDQAELQVRICLSTLDSPHYNAIEIHKENWDGTSGVTSGSVVCVRLTAMQTTHQLSCTTKTT